ncbi:Gamma-butyrobetaine dioxygenase [Trichoplax sp. H2]|nr:Gamma-butyrobetaine dioxygenase [Trichoplax sp. H2]|eukprot:RDD38646.1 Gamma-butyrobetaine dioxygenase [Trichoplax sp. H2]
MSSLLRSRNFNLVKMHICNTSSSLINQYKLPFLPKVCYSVQVKNDLKQKCVNLTWEDGITTRYPHLYLRDHCRCSACYDSISEQRFLFNCIYDNYKDKIAKEVRICDKGERLQIDWYEDEKHPYSEFKLDWLRKYRFSTEEDEMVASNIYHRDRQIWGSEMLNKIPRYDFYALLQDKLELYRWLRSLIKIGITILDNVPEKPGQMHKLADRVSFLKLTTYGPTFQVESRSVASNVAFTNAGLAMHTDLAFITYVPGVQMLHCISKAGQGGESRFVDGFRAATQLKEKYPEAFNLLVKYPIRYYDVGKDYITFNQLTQHPIIRLHDNGELKQIVYADHPRSPLMGVPQNKVIDLYDAMSKFLECVYDPSNMIYTLLESGSMMVLDNFRVMHGRASYEVKPGSCRHLEGGYLDWDEVTSRMRVLERELNIDYTSAIV